MTRMKNIFAVIAVVAFLCTGAFAQEKSSKKDSTKSESTETEKVKKPRAESLPENIEKAQQALKTKGLYKGGATGKMDADTKAAVKAFQEQQGFKPTGRLNKDTRVALGIEAGTTSAKSAKKGKAKEPKAEEPKEEEEEE